MASNGTFSFNTALTRRLGIRLPLLGAPMARCAGGDLAAAVSRAGGLGFIGGSSGSAELFDAEFARAGDSPVGIGFITWLLADKPELLDAALAHRPAAVMLSFGNHEPFIDAVKATGVPVVCQVQTIGAAEQAITTGADIIVAQGQEAGGHGIAGRSTLTLAPAIVDRLGGAVPVVAAGGIADGRGLAAALMLGCDGALMGTRLVATLESVWPQHKKSALVEASAEDTVRTEVFDILRRGEPWPTPFDGRALRNTMTERWHGNESALYSQLGQEQTRFAAAEERGDPMEAAVWAGECVDLIDAIEPAEALITRIARQAEGLLVGDNE